MVCKGAESFAWQLLVQNSQSECIGDGTLPVILGVYHITLPPLNPPRAPFAFAVETLDGLRTVESGLFSIEAISKGFPALLCLVQSA